MRKVMFACAAMVGFTNVAAASELGIASYYLNPHYSGLIAAHKTLPMGTRVKVVNLDNGRSAILKIVDRGPFIRGRIIDVSPAAASVLGFRAGGPRACAARAELISDNLEGRLDAALREPECDRLRLAGIQA